MLGEAQTTLLPHGLYDESGQCHREAELRPLSGEQELMLTSAGERADSPSVSRLLATCVSRIGGYREIDAEHTAALTRGDRQHLLLWLRRSLFGDRIALVVKCPNPTCGALADLDARVESVAPERPAGAPETFSVETEAGRARLREPTGADDAAVAQSQLDRAARAALLWSRLVVDLDGRALSPADWSALPQPVRHAIALALAENSSAPDLAFLSRCPTCRAWLELELNPLSVLARELRVGAERLLAEVHSLAFHYHWSEEEILKLPRARRWRYLELVRRELEGRPLVEGLA
jgi:hypothetical protein